MKPVTGSITSSQPISLSKAARALSTFLAHETETSQAVTAYLKRTSVSFNELVQFHKDLKSGKFNHKKSRSQTAEIQENEGENQRLDEPSAVSRGLEGHRRNLDQERGDFDDGRKSERKKKRREVLNEKETDEKEEKKREKRKKIEIDYGSGDSNEKLNSEKKKKKRKRMKGEEE